MPSLPEDDFTYNPFAQNPDSPTTAKPNGYFSTAFFPNLGSPGPELRRRRPSVGAAAKDDRERPKHKRAFTDLDIVPISTAIHPLKSALAGKYASLFSDDVTRPHLSRVVNEAGPSESQDGEDDSKVESRQGKVDEERDVIVHHVLSTDSLAGVSLRYGISLTNLRRANHLWANDSIHLRDILYVPVDQATRAKELFLDAALNSPEDTNRQSPSSPVSSSATSASQSDGDFAETSPPSPSVPIRRISAKHLSYFPPPTAKSSLRKINSLSDEPPSPDHRGKPPLRLTPGGHRNLPNSSLTSLLIALPLAASTRDEIITRLSMDSSRSSDNSPDEGGHELGEVGRSKGADQNGHPRELEVDEMSMPTPKPLQGVEALRLSKRQPSGNQNTYENGPISRSLSSSTSPPRFYVSQINDSFIRTSQLEPSPAMQLPPSRSGTLTRSSGQKLLYAAPLTRHHSLNTSGVDSVTESEMRVLGSTA